METRVERVEGTERKVLVINEKERKIFVVTQGGALHLNATIADSLDFNLGVEKMKVEARRIEKEEKEEKELLSWLRQI